MKLPKWSLFLVVVLLLPLLLLLNSFSAAPLLKPTDFLGTLPIAAPPAGMAIFQLPTGITHRSAAFGYRGGSFFDKRDFAMTAVLVKHPKGDLLIDTGFGHNIDEQFKLMPLLFRWGTSYEKQLPAATQLTQAGYDRKNLRGILLTHAHWDHVSGIPDFPAVPVFITSDERRFIDSGSAWTAVTRGMADIPYQEYSFADKSYLGFHKSYDWYGDGSIVLVPAPGHTPGSIIVFLALPDGRRYAFLGDLVWQREGITEREEKSWLLRTFADSEPAQVRENILRMAALAARFPALIIVPAHDQRGFAEMPKL